MTGVSVFYSYSHKDESFCDSLRAHLSILERKGEISSWHDRKIKPGQIWNQEIDRNINNADIVILLVSADFVASDYCYQEELKVAMERHESNQAIVVPVILRPVDFSETPFAKIQALPKDAKPITLWQNEDEAWINVVSGIKGAIRELNSLKTRSTADEGFKGIRDHLARELDSLESAFELGGQNSTTRGLPTGLSVLDDVTDGLHKSDFVVIAGRPGMGKTDLALRFACNVAMSEKKAVGFFSLNLPVDRLMRKMLSSLGRLSSFKLFKGDMEENDWPRLTAAVSLLKDLPLYIDDHISLNIDQLRERAVKLKTEKGAQLILIDSLQHIDLGFDNSTNQDVTKALSRLARELEIPVVVTSTIGRDLENRVNKRPVMQDLSAWRSVEDDSDMLIFVYRDEIYNSDSPDTGLAELIVAKNQATGLIGTVKVSYSAGVCSFDNIV